MKKSLIVLLLILSTSTSAFAGDAFGDLFKSALYGAAVGGLVGAATLAFANSPKDHTDNIAVGAAVGVMAGVLFSAASQTRGGFRHHGMLDVDEGNLKVAIPTVIPSFIAEDTSSIQTTRRAGMEVKVALLTGRF